MTNEELALALVANARASRRSREGLGTLRENALVDALESVERELAEARQALDRALVGKVEPITATAPDGTVTHGTAETPWREVAERAESERDEARAQLAALHAAASAVQTRARALPVSMTEIVHAEEWDDLDRVLAALATSAAEYDARVRAPVEAERDTLAAALAEVMTPRGIYDAWSLNRVLRRLADAADHLLNDHSCDRHGYEGVVCARDAARDHAAAIEKLSIPADLAAQREARIRADERAKALRDDSLLKRLSDAALLESERIVRQVREFDRTGVSTAAHGEWDTLFDLVLGRALSAMADEADRGTR